MPRLSNVEQANRVRAKGARNDCYYTPETLVDIHLAIIQPLTIPDKLILEPSRGLGAYYDKFLHYFPKNQYAWCEIADGRDFFEYEGEPEGATPPSQPQPRPQAELPEGATPPSQPQPRPQAELPDIIITNPPFSLLSKFIQKSISLKPRIISFLLNAYAVTPCRIRDFNAAGYYLVKLHFTRVDKWFGVSCIIVLSREATSNIVSFDTTKHILEKSPVSV